MFAKLRKYKSENMQIVNYAGKIIKTPDKQSIRSKKRG